MCTFRFGNGNFTAHDRARRNKPIAEHADSAFGYILCLCQKNSHGPFSRFQSWE